MSFLHAVSKDYCTVVAGDISKAEISRLNKIKYH